MLHVDLLRASLPLTARVFLHRGLVAGGLLVEPRLMKARQDLVLGRQSPHSGTLPVATVVSGGGIGMA